MATNLDLDDKLIDEARRLGHHKTKKATVTAALQEYIQRRNQLKIVDLFGATPYVKGFDHRAERSRSRQ
ncbi:MAG: type II toxin-antitoxin system VapB family antitoxin [Planctomycetota bacterium]